MKFLKLFVLALALILSFVTFETDISACSCMIPSIEEHIGAVDYLFIGEIIDVEKREENDGSDRFTINIKESFKGGLSIGKAEVFGIHKDFSNEAACILGYPEEGKFLFSASKQDSKIVVASHTCFSLYVNITEGSEYEEQGLERVEEILEVGGFERGGVITSSNKFLEYGFILLGIVVVIGGGVYVVTRIKHSK